MEAMPVSVIGSGIIGLTSAIALQEAGSSVCLFAKERFNPDYALESVVRVQTAIKSSI